MPATSSITVAATIAAEALRVPFERLCARLGLDVDVRFAPHQQLVAGEGGGFHVALVRLEDWRGGVAELAVLLRGASLCGILPPSPARAQADRAAESELRAALAGTVEVFGPADVAAQFPVEDVHDPYADRVAQVPYTARFLAALAAYVLRRAHARLRAPYKVLALDCDQTLWRGVCAEDGAAGVVVDEPRRVLQERAVALARGGMLLAVCSKNDEADVHAAFARDDMLLRAEQVSAWRVGWRPKSQLLRELAAELGLGLDSFILVDDSPAECAEVRAHAPEVCVLELPADAAAIPRFLDGAWALDRSLETADDRARGQRYRAERARAEAAGRAPTFKEFLASLALTVEIAPLTADDVERAAQLTMRVNQLNTTTRRRAPAELRALAAAGRTVWTVRARDRFGDHGLAGVAIFGEAAGALAVDSLLLSCRVLGRGVEARVVRSLGDEAVRRGLSHVDFELADTARNRPARALLESLDGALEQGGVVRVSAASAGAARSTPFVAAAVGVAAASASATSGARVHPPVVDAMILDEIIVARPAAGSSVPAESRAPLDAAERRLVALSARLLGRELGTDEDFFAAGGSSLDAVRLLSSVESALGRTVALDAFLRSPTVAQLAALVQDGAQAGTSLVALEPRGSRPPFFCVTGIGGSPFALRALAQELAARDQPFFALRPPVDERGHAQLDTVEALAAHYVTALSRVQARGPYLLGGFSFGGLVACEMARQLHAHGERASLVALLDADLPGNHAGGDVPARLQRLRGELRFWAEHLTKVPRPVFRLMIEQARARARYRAQPVPARLTLFFTEEWPFDPRWDALAESGVERVRLPGGHAELLLPPSVSVVAAELDRRLAAAQAR